MPDAWRAGARRRRRKSRRPLFVLLGGLACVFVVAGAVLAGGLSFLTPDPVAAVPAALDPTAAAQGAAPLATPGSTAASVVDPTDAPAVTAAPGSKPWLAWKPSGAGQVNRFNMSAPWTGGTSTDVSVYTPPGYNSEGSRLYPVIYEAPTGLTLWSSRGASAVQLDSLIDSGAIPAVIVVFIDESSPPYSPSECADSFDGKQWFETFISDTMVNWVDVTYKTIPDPRARAIMGMSEGGFCAAMLATRHPDVFGVSISFSGYFYAGVAGSGSAVPFGGIDGLGAHSPALIAPQIPTATRAGMYFIVVADPGQAFFGSQATSFEEILKTNGYRYLAVNSKYGHGWDEVQVENPRVLAAWGAQLVKSGLM